MLSPVLLLARELLDLFIFISQSASSEMKWILEVT